MKRKSDYTPFGREIAIRLMERNMTAKELALKIGATPAVVSYIMTGKRNTECYVKAIRDELNIGEEIA